MGTTNEAWESFRTRAGFPLDLACDNSSSEAVVELMLQQPGGKDLVLMPTLFLI